MYRHHLEKLVRTRLDDILVDEGVLDRAKLQEIQSEQDQTGGLLSDVLVESGGFDEWELAKLQVKAYGLPFVDAKLYGVRREVLDLLPLDYCRKRGFLPLDQFGQSIAIACWEVPTAEVLEDITARTKHSVFLYIAVRRTVLEVLDELIKKNAARAALPKPRPPAPVRVPVVAPAAAAAPVVVPPIVPIMPASLAPAPSMLSNASLAGSSAAFGSADPEQIVAGRQAAVPAPAMSWVDDAEAALPPLSIPFISMKLNATAQDVAAPRRSVVRSARAESLTGARSVTGVAAGYASSPGVSQVPAASVPASPSVLRTASPALGGTASPPGDPARPRITRAAPVIPAALGPAAAPRSAEWESIFDIGESAVHDSTPGDDPPPHAPPKPTSKSSSNSTADPRGRS